MSGELKPCPHCGGAASYRNGGPGCWFVQCDICNATSDDGSSERAATRWNNRTPNPALAAKDATIAELRKRLEWQPLDSAPKNPKGGVWGPEILLCTKHGGVEFVVIARYVAGHHHAWLDTNPDSSVGARLGDDAGWMPKPLGPAARAALEATR